MMEKESKCPRGVYKVKTYGTLHQALPLENPYILVHYRSTYSAQGYPCPGRMNRIGSNARLLRVSRPNRGHAEDSNGI